MKKIIIISLLTSSLLFSLENYKDLEMKILNGDDSTITKVINEIKDEDSEEVRKLFFLAKENTIGDLNKNIEKEYELYMNKFNKKIVKNNSNKLNFELTKELNLSKLKLDLITGRDLDKIKVTIDNIKIGKLLELSERELEIYGSIIEPILLEGLKDKNENLRIISTKLLDKQGELKNIIENLFDELEITNESLPALYNLKDIQKYEKYYLNAFKKSSENVQEKILIIAKEKQLNSIVQEYEKVKEKAIQEQKKIESEKIAKLELKKKQESELTKKLKDIEDKEKQLKQEQANKKVENKTEPKIVKVVEKEQEEIVTKISTKSVDEIILTSLDDKEKQYQAIIEVGNLEMKSAIPKLGNIIKTSKDTKTRKQVLFSLTKIGNSDAKKILEEYSKSDDKILSFIAKKSLESLETKK